MVAATASIGRPLESHARIWSLELRPMSAFPVETSWATLPYCGSGRMVTSRPSAL